MKFSLRTSLGLLSLCSAVPLLVFVTVGGIEFAQSQKDAFGRDVVAMARAISVAIDNDIRDYRIALEALGQANSLTTGNLPAFHERMSEASRMIGTSVTLCGPSGALVLAAGAARTDACSSAVLARAVESNRWQVSKIFRDLQTPTPRAEIALPVVVAGQHGYAVTAALRLVWLKELFDVASLPPEWLGGVVDSAHNLVHWTKRNDTNIGRGVTEAWQDAITPDSDHGWAPVWLPDGKTLYVGYFRSGLSGWIVGIGVPAHEVWAPFWNWVTPLAAAGTVLVSLGLLIAAILAHYIEQPIRALARLTPAQQSPSTRSAPIHIHEIEEVAATLRDMESERRVVQNALREHEAQLRLVTDSAPFFLVRYNRFYRCTYANRSFSQRFGKSPDDIVGLTAADILGEAAFTTVRPIMDAALAGQVTEAELDVHYAIIGLRTILCTVIPDRSPSGAIVGVIAFILDVTVRKQADEALRAGDARWRALVEAMPQFVWSCRADGSWDYVSPQWVQYTGLTAQDLLGFGWLKVVHPHDRSDVVRTWRRARRQLGSYDVECRLRRSDGDWRWFRARGTRIEGDAFDERQWVGTCTDIDEQRSLADRRLRLNEELEARVREEMSQRERAQTDLAQAQKLQALGQLAGGIAHDFNNVLHTLAVGVRHIIRRRADSDQVANLGRMMEDTVMRGAAITRRLLAFARRDELRTEAVDVEALLSGIRELLQHTTGSGINVTLSIAGCVPQVEADKSQLEAVLINLAVNARDAMPDGGTITLLAEHITGLSLPELDVDRNYIRLSVIDNGTGMTAETLAHATEPFFTTKPEGQGTGLGLAMARGFAEQSNGALNIHSTLGKGTRIDLLLPEFKVESQLPERAGFDASFAAGSIQVLLVDDDDVALQGTADELRDQGFTIVTAASGREALEILRTVPRIDFLVSDLTMPGMDGISLIVQAQALRPGLPAILATGDISNAAARTVRGLVRGPFYFAPKPISGRQLASRIMTMLASFETGAIHND